MEKTRFNPLVLLLMAGAAAIYLVHGWLLRPDLWFVFDDFAWLYKGRFSDAIANFTYWPVQGYNDRPMGGVYFQALYSAFGLNAPAWHGVGLAIHFANGALLFDILRRLNQSGILPMSRFIRTFAPLLFLAWPKSTLAVQWPAAIFDLLGAFFIFASVDAFLAARSSRGPRAALAGLLTLLAFYLGLRTKELAVVVIPVALVISVADWRARQLPARKILSICAPIVLLGLAFATTIFMYIRGGGQGLSDSDSPYQITLSPLILARNLGRYLALYFDSRNVSFDFTGISPLSAGLIFLATAVAGVFLGFRRSRVGLAGLAFFFISLDRCSR